MQIAFLVDPAHGMTPYRPLVTLTMGPDFVQTGYAQTRALLPPFQNHYTATHSQQTFTDIGIFLGVERIIASWLTTDLGISGYIDNTLSPRGEVWQFAVPAYDTLGYQYHIYNKRVVFTNKLLTTIPPYQALHPYFSWEAGVAFNNAKDYSEYPLVSLATPTAPFANHSQLTMRFDSGTTTFTTGSTGSANYIVSVGSLVPGTLSLNVNTDAEWASQIQNGGTSLCSGGQPVCTQETFSLQGGQSCCLMFTLNGANLTAGSYVFSPNVTTHPSAYTGQAASTSITVTSAPQDTTLMTSIDTLALSVNCKPLSSCTTTLKMRL